jgi:glycine hydroxymethyltransferase
VKTYKTCLSVEAYLNAESRQGKPSASGSMRKVRMAHNSDQWPTSGVIGWVTSCAVDSEGFLTGQAYLDLKNSEEGSQIFIFQSASDKAGKVPADFVVGDRATIPTPATVISRFPK